MKVLHYVASLTRSAGGLYTAVTGLSNALASAGAHVVVAGATDEFFAEDKQQWKGAKVVPVASGYHHVGKFLSVVRETEPDLIHVQGLWGPISMFGLAGSFKVPVVVSPHGMLDPWILARRRRLKSVHSALFERPMLRRGYLHALNDNELSAASAYSRGIEDRAFIIPNGVPEIEGRVSGGPRCGVLYLSRLHEKKQTLELALAWEAAPELRDIELTIAGWGDEAYEARLREATAGAGNVRFVGPLYGAEKQKALNSARFFILPSLSEGLPMAVLEAIQHGCVPLITDQCNLPELFSDDIAVRIDSTLCDLVSVVVAINSLPGTTLAERSATAAAYSERYLWSNIATRMAAQYERIVSGS